MNLIGAQLSLVCPTRDPELFQAGGNGVMVNGEDIGDGPQRRPAAGKVCAIATIKWGGTHESSRSRRYLAASFSRNGMTGPSRALL